MAWIQLTPKTVQLLKEQGRGTYFFDRLDKGNGLEIPKPLYDKIQRITPIGKSMDSTIQRLIMEGA